MPKAVKKLQKRVSGVDGVRIGQRKTAAQRGYGGKWRKARLKYLQNNPLCVFCRDKGIIKSATVVDHITPHKGDMKLFWDRANWQSLCKRCHDSDKQRLENKKGGAG